MIDTTGKDEDIKNLRESIKSQGWSDLGEQLPGLWLVRVEGNQLTFITESGDVVRGLVRAEIYLHQHSSDLEQDLKKVRSLKIDRSQEDHIAVDIETIKTEGWICDETVPQGWSHRTLQLGESKSYQMLSSPYLICRR